MADPNLELLAVIHSQQSMAYDMQVALTLVATTASEPTVEFSVETVTSIATVIGAQREMVANLVEQNQKIYDRIMTVLERLEKETDT